MPRQTPPARSAPTLRRLTIRIPDQLYQDIQRVAKAQARSGNGQILAILQQQLAQQPSSQGVRDGSQR